MATCSVKRFGRTVGDYLQIVSSLPKEAIEPFLPAVVNILTVLAEVGISEGTEL